VNKQVISFFGSTAATGEEGFLASPLFSVLVVILGIYVFIKFCTWAKNFELSAQFKKIVYILTAVGMVVFNVLYSRGNALIKETGDWGTATTAVVLSLIWVFIFSFVLMANTKKSE